MKQTALLEGPHDEELRIASNGQQETKALISKASRNRMLPKTGKLRICFPLIEPWADNPVLSDTFIAIF